MGIKCIFCGKETVEVVDKFGSIDGKKLLRPKVRGTIFRCYNCKKHSVDYNYRPVNDEDGVQKTIQDSK